MGISSKLSERNSGICELCNSLPAENEYTVTPKTDEVIENQVAICNVCLDELGKENNGNYWRFLVGTIWSNVAGVQALSYRLLQMHKQEEWANEIINSVELDENIVEWAMSFFEVADLHKDAFGNTLENGDNVVLTQALNVKGTNFTAAKGTVVRKIKLVHDNTGQIEGKINDQTIVILTQYVKKGS